MNLSESMDDTHNYKFLTKQVRNIKIPGKSFQNMMTNALQTVSP
jgi:hypothetical protein